MGSQVMVPYRGLDEEWRHLKLMGDLGQVLTRSTYTNNALSSEVLFYSVAELV